MRHDSVQRVSTLGCVALSNWTKNPDRRLGSEVRKGFKTSGRAQKQCCHIEPQHILSVSGRADDRRGTTPDQTSAATQTRQQKLAQEDLDSPPPPSPSFWISWLPLLSPGPVRPSSLVQILQASPSVTHLLPISLSNRPHLSLATTWQRDPPGLCLIPSPVFPSVLGFTYSSQLLSIHLRSPDGVLFKRPPSSLLKLSLPLAS